VEKCKNRKFFDEIAMSPHNDRERDKDVRQKSMEQDQMIALNTPRRLSAAGRVSLQCATALAVVLGISSVACAQKKTPEVSTETSSGTSATAPAATTQAAKEASKAKEGKEDAGWLAAIKVGTPLPDDILKALSERRHEDAYKLLVKLDPKPKKEPYQALVYGRVAGLVGKPEVCSKVLGEVIKQKTVLADYAQIWGAQCAFDKKDWATAAERAAMVSPESEVHDDALFLLGESLYNGKTSSDKKKAIKVYDAYLKSYSKRRSADVVRARNAELLLEKKQYDDAAILLNDIITYHPLSDLVPGAIEQLGKIKPKLSSSTREKISATSDEQRIRKLRALFSRHRSEEAVVDGARYAKIFAKGGELYCEANYLVGKSYTKLRKHPDSISWYENVAKNCPGSTFVIKSYYNMGRGQWNSGDRKAAKRAFEKLWKGFPTSSYADDAMLYVARILREEGDLKGMRKQLERQVKAYPDGDMANDAHWLLVRDMITRDKWKEVIAYVDSVDDPQENDLYSAGRLKYYKGRALEKLKKKEESNKIYREVAVENPLGFYAMLSLNHLARQAGVKEVPEDVCAVKEKELCGFLSKAAAGAAPMPVLDLPDGLTEDANFVRGGALLKLGLGEEAEDEFRQLRSKWSADDQSKWALAMLLDAAGAYPLSHNIPRRNIDDWETGYPSAITKQHWEIAYPAPFEPLVSKWADKREIPGELVWAIMREESGFNPGIESWANARGLLQLMEGTAKSVASKDDFEVESASQLFDAETNVRLGTAYMRELGEEFKNHPAMIIAGYNAGAGNVRRWVDARGDLPLDLWIEDIPYGQTRNYTKRVLTSFWTYHYLYGKGRTPGLPMEIPKAG